MHHSQWHKRRGVISMAAIALLLVLQFDFDQRRQSNDLFGQQFRYVIHGEYAFKPTVFIHNGNTTHTLSEASDSITTTLPTSLHLNAGTRAISK